MLYQKLIYYYIFLRELILKYLFGKITMLNFKKTYYPVNFLLPYFMYFILEFFKINYVYQYDNISYFQDYKDTNIIIPPIISFKIDGNDYLGKIKLFQGNVPIIYFLYTNKIINPSNTEITYFNNGSMKNKKIKNLLNFNNLCDVFK